MYRCVPELCVCPCVRVSVCLCVRVYERERDGTARVCPCDVLSANRDDEETMSRPLRPFWNDPTRLGSDPRGARSAIGAKWDRVSDLRQA
ncbi:unnamed protein product [Protopolystoma xenopodis]|uniref:Uncharacterized protein n=1 Tax=Protopolystoma xenopodis TaxID=117903 RepID=A0A448XNP3_9PLAT|nr:unnamed protein product [Protopolystoma xenopodis]